MQWFLYLEARGSLGLEAKFSLGNKLKVSMHHSPGVLSFRSGTHAGKQHVLSRAGEQTASVAICCRQENSLVGAPCQGVADLQRPRKPSPPPAPPTHPAGGAVVKGCRKLWADAGLLSISCGAASSVWSSWARPSALPCLGMELYISPISSSSFMVKKLKKKKKPNPLTLRD